MYTIFGDNRFIGTPSVVEETSSILAHLLATQLSSMLFEPCLASFSFMERLYEDMRFSCTSSINYFRLLF